MLKLKYTNKSDIPTGAEGFYTEKDGEFVLQAEGVDTSKLESALQSERKIRREAEAKVKDLENKYSLLPDDFDINEYNAMKDKTLTGGDIDQKLKEQRESINAQHQKELQRLQEQLQQKDELVNVHVKSNTLQKAMVEAGIGKQYMPAVEAMMREKIKIEGTDVYLNEKPVSEALKEWANSDDGKHYVAASSNTGGGTYEAGKPNGAGKREMKRADFTALDPSKQMELAKGGVQLID